MESITQYIQARVDAITRQGTACYFGAAVNEYHELNLALQAAGHDTSELHAAVLETRECIVKLRAVRDQAVKRFKEKGALFTVVPLEKEEKVPLEKDEKVPLEKEEEEERLVFLCNEGCSPL